jgi:hypothetical protein
MKQTDIAHCSGGIVFLSEKEKNMTRGIQRYRLTSPRTYSLDVIAFAQPTRTEHIVRIMDFSVVGVGIELAERIEPGLVYFKEPVGGQKFGVLVWSNQRGDRYRAGIKFVVLSSEEESHLLEQVKQPHLDAAPRAPDKIIASLLESIQRETNR